MSFSSQVKEELSKISNLANKEGVKQEFIGYLLSNNTRVLKNKIKYATDNEYNINRFQKLLCNLGESQFQIEVKGKTYSITFAKQEIEELMITQDVFEIKEKQITYEEASIKAILRGAFLGGGSVNNPEKKYHLEIILSTRANAIWLQQLLEKVGIKTKLLERKKGYSLYIKEGEEISKFLAFIGANSGVLAFEEIRVIREVKNKVNRRVNCETANLEKTVDAAVRQIEAIKKLKKQGKFEQLSDPLKEMANTRLAYPDATLIELGQQLKQPIGKSGVNHRLQAILKEAGEEE